jgi:hypothetical protein
VPYGVEAAACACACESVGVGASGLGNCRLGGFLLSLFGSHIFDAGSILFFFPIPQFNLGSLFVFAIRLLWCNTHAAAVSW